MEEGKINAWQFGATEKPINVYKNACATLGNTLLAWGRFGSIQLVNQPVVYY
jgi:hypothetical protein